MSGPLFSDGARRGVAAPDLDPDLPGGRGFIALLEAFRASGGTVPGEVVGRLLEEHGAGPAVSLAQLIHSGQAFGFEWRASLWIPMFQFDADSLALKVEVQCVRAQLPLLWSGWALAAWFATPNVFLQGACPVELLDTERAAVMGAARAMRPFDASRFARTAFTAPTAAQARRQQEVAWLE